MVNCLIQKVSNPDLVKDFILKSGNSLRTFRYFNNRSYDVICNHVVTYLLDDDLGIPVCYGHLEFEANKLWLGIAVSEKHKGKGFGSLMLGKLINTAREIKSEELYLTVDLDNNPAIRLYEKFGFIFIEKKNEQVQLMRLTLHE